MRNKIMGVSSSFLPLLVHIPKCAGTSFRYSVISPNIEPALIYQPNSWREFMFHTQDFRYLVGHFEFGVGNFINPHNPARKRKKIYLTFLRNPVDQMISYYYFKQQNAKEEQAEAYELDKVIDFYKKNINLCNMQTQFCSGFLLNRLYLKLQITLIGQLQLRMAKKNLLSGFHFVGCFESIERDSRLLCEFLQFKYEPIYAEVTRTKMRPSVSDLTADQYAELEAINSLDTELYHFAKECIWDSAIREDMMYKNLS